MKNTRILWPDATQILKTSYGTTYFSSPLTCSSWRGPGEDASGGVQLSSRNVLAVSERMRGPCFILTHRKWEGSGQVGGACCWRRNSQHWRNYGRRQAYAQLHKYTHANTHTRTHTYRIRTQVTDLFVLSPPLSPVWGGCSHLHTQWAESIGGVDPHTKVQRQRVGRLP